MIKTICVCGGGAMGSGIAQLSAQAGFNVILYDLNQDVLNNAAQKINASLDFLLQKEKISLADRDKIFQRIQFTYDIRTCIADLFIEAIVEDLSVKQSLFNEIYQVNAGNPEAIFATNTSSLSINAIANNCPRPNRFVGIHFFNPAPVMKLVEIIHGTDTSAEVISTVKDLITKMGKTPVLCSDSPGFIVNHVARPFYIESLYLLENKVADIQTIDDLIESCGFKMGPFRLMDLIGNDVNYAVSKSVYEAMHQPSRLKPSVIQEQKVKEKNLGRKTGRGYYHYDVPASSK